ncbi:DNA methyltransferase [Geobacillus stearothermophilus]|nr:DNA methyltransferase [Geobacillus stearothermophilus]
MDEKQLSLLDDHEQADNGPVVCLGMTFKNDEERREYFRNELRKKLPELKKIEGFPIGDDEDIIALSDPPYYTACPNPWINDFIEEWEREKKEKYGRDENEEYHREPFAADVSEGKKNAIYNAHSYHTKVPHKALMRYLLHYTNPGDIILDGFSGTGMTSVASNLCDSDNEIKSLGFEIKNGNIISSDNPNLVYKKGPRKTIASDLSPIASYISYGYNINANIEKLTSTFNRIINKIEEKYGWMYKTEYNGQIANINYVVWSDVFVCPNCSFESTFWDIAVDEENSKVLTRFHCKNCNSELTKKDLEKVMEHKYDNNLNKIINITKKVPVKINLSLQGTNVEKRIEAFDLEILKKVEDLNFEYWIPTYEFPDGEKTQELKRTGITHVHHIFFKRSLLILSYFNHLITEMANDINEEIILRNVLTGGMLGLTKLQRYRPNSTFPNMILSGTLYVGSINREWNPIEWLKGKLSGIIRAKEAIQNSARTNVNISCNTATKLQIKDNSIDYIFTDPPFGANLMYSELNFIWESWLKVRTNVSPEAIVNKVQGKNVFSYQRLMEECFKEYYRVLKPNRWITVEFSNSQASIWNAIQEALQKAGFVIANVAALDKRQGSFNAITSTTAVKQDLVISAYKPKTEHIEKMRREQNTEESAWTFVRQHLEQLPVFIGNKGEAQIIAERTPRILFDRMVAYHVQNGLPVPISSAEFQAKVAQRFPMRDGMVFLESQVAEYDKKRTLVKEFVQMSLFVTDETSAIEWLRQQLLKKPQTRQDLHPNFMKEIQHIAKHEKLPELDDLLEQNFLKYEGEGPVPDQIGSYLRRNYKDLRGLENDDPQLKEKAMNRWYVPDPNKQADLEKLREKALLREFEGYVEELSKSKKKLKQFRTEAIRAGFKKAWSEKDYETIMKVGERLPESVIQEDDKLLMYYDNAQIRLGM